MKQKFLKYGVASIALITVFGLGFMTGCSNHRNDYEHHADAESAIAKLPASLSIPHTVPATGTIEVAFSPNGGAEQAVVKAINEAHKSIMVQAYSFTNKEIARALLLAKKRGVEVRVILDKSQKTAKYSSYKFFRDEKIPVKIDYGFEIAHNKIMIIDNETVITGSFNFTNAAQRKNAENLLIIRGDQKLANLYIENWQWRWNACQF